MTDPIAKRVTELKPSGIRKFFDIVNEMKKASGFLNAKVVATGGLGRIIADDTEEIDVYDPNLTLRGLQILYNKNRRSKPQLKEFADENTPE